MDKFVKDKLDTARIQPLPSTWEGIESQLDKDRKSILLRRSVFLFVGLMVIGVSFYATSDLWKSTREVKNGLVELESIKTIPNMERLETDQRLNQGEQERTTDLLPVLNDDESSLKVKTESTTKKILAVQASITSETGPVFIQEPRLTQANQGAFYEQQISSPSKYIPSLFDDYTLDSQVAELAHNQLNINLPEEMLYSKESRFSIQHTIGITSSFYTNSLSHLNYLNDSRGLGTDFQLLAGYELSKKWSIQTGIRYAKYGWISNVGEPIDSNSAGITTGGKESSGYAQGNEVILDNYLKYVSVPLYVNYKILNRDAFDISLSAGISGDMLVNANVTEFVPAATSYVNVLEDSKSPQSFQSSGASAGRTIEENVLEKYGWSYHLSVPLVYKWKKLQLSAAPFGVWQGKPFMTTYSSDRKANAFGLRLGLKIKL